LLKKALAFEALAALIPPVTAIIGPGAGYRIR
jgi:hypothetical protein